MPDTGTYILISNSLNSKLHLSSKSPPKDDDWINPPPPTIAPGGNTSIHLGGKIISGSSGVFVYSTSVKKHDGEADTDNQMGVSFTVSFACPVLSNNKWVASSSLPEVATVETVGFQDKVKPVNVQVTIEKADAYPEGPGGAEAFDAIYQKLLEASKA